jgi:hypothetical protein
MPMSLHTDHYFRNLLIKLRYAVIAPVIPTIPQTFLCLESAGQVFLSLRVLPHKQQQPLFHELGFSPCPPM